MSCLSPEQDKTDSSVRCPLPICGQPELQAEAETLGRRRSRRTSPQPPWWWWWGSPPPQPPPVSCSESLQETDEEEFCDRSRVSFSRERKPLRQTDCRGEQSPSSGCQFQPVYSVVHPHLLSCQGCSDSELCQQYPPCCPREQS